MEGGNVGGLELDERGFGEVRGLDADELLEASEEFGEGGSAGGEREGANALVG